MGQLRMKERLEKVVNEVDAGYDKLAELQAEGDTAGFSEESL